MPTHQTLLSRQDGAITVMVVLLLPVMLLMLALIVNINYLIFQKIRLQNVVDACALSAAAVQAAGLNEIAHLNKDLEEESKKIGRFLDRGVWYDIAHAEKARNFFFSRSKSGVLDHIYKYQMQANMNYARWAHEAAMIVWDKNLKRKKPVPSSLQNTHDTGALADFRMHNKKRRFSCYTLQDTSNASPKMTRKWPMAPDDPRYSGAHNGVYDLPAKRREVRRSFFNLPYKLEKRGTTIADYEIILAPHSFPLANPLFGGVPELKARATAKPAGGHIYRAEPKYRALLIR